MAKRTPGKVDASAALAEIERALERQRELTKDLDPDEVYRVVTEIVEEVRQERYDKRQRNR